jgi:hypothetical protein
MTFLCRTLLNTLKTDDIPQQSVQFFPNSKITDIGIKQLAISQTKNLRKPKARWSKKLTTGL